MRRKVTTGQGQIGNGKGWRLPAWVHFDEQAFLVQTFQVTVKLTPNVRTSAVCAGLS
jgi:hypothetical protein